MSEELSKYNAIERSSSSSFQLLLAALSSNLFNEDHIISPFALVNIEGCIFVFSLSVNA